MNNYPFYRVYEKLVNVLWMFDKRRGERKAMSKMQNRKTLDFNFLLSHSHDFNLAFFHVSQDLKESSTGYSL